MSEATLSVERLLTILLHIELVAHKRVQFREIKILEVWGGFSPESVDLKNARETGFIDSAINAMNDVIYGRNVRVLELLGKSCALVNLSLRLQKLDFFTISSLIHLLDQTLEEEVWACMIRAMGRLYPNQLYYPLPPRDPYGSERYEGSRNSLRSGEDGDETHETFLIRKIEYVRREAMKFYDILQPFVECEEEDRSEGKINPKPPSPTTTTTTTTVEGMELTSLYT